jgi:hypothetical protein
MGLFAGVIFVEKILSRGIWILWTAEIVFAAAGVMTVAGIVQPEPAMILAILHTR